MLLLRPDQIGEPDWEQIPPGDYSTTLTQWLNLRTKEWTPVDWFTSDRFVTRMENNYRRPITLRAKIQAIWAARNKLFKRYILMRKKRYGKNG